MLELTQGQQAHEGWRHGLARQAQRLATFTLQWALEAEGRRSGRDRLPAHIEFHAEAGAPEGALYIDGEFVGHLTTRRL